jgi:branched-chain amino acid transport system permease protein
MDNERRSLRLRSTTKNNIVTLVLVAVAFAVVQTLISTGNMKSLYTGLMVPICYYVILAVSLNLTVGVLGELSLGHAGFMCVGAYASSLFSVAMQESLTNDVLRFTIAIVIGGLAAALFGFLIGIPVLRLRGDYLAIVTLAFGEIIKNLVNNIYIAKDINGWHISMSADMKSNLDLETKKMLLDGAAGIRGTPKDANFIAGFILVMITLIVIMNLVDSRAGRAIKSIRDNRIAAESIGINITKYKLIAFTVSAFFAGTAGVLYSHNVATLQANTKNFGYTMSIMILVMVVLGGMGKLRGSVVAAVILTILPEALRGLAEYRMIIYAVVIIAMMILNNNDKFKLLLDRINPKKLLAAQKAKKEVR